MIASLSGLVSHLSASACILEVGGVGYRILLAPGHALELRTGAKATIRTHLVVREDALTLYGFRDDREEELFAQLCTVTGVGPKSALGVLAQLTPDEVSRAVADGDVAVFKRVSGVGPKTAQLIIVSLAGKLAPPAAAGAAVPGATPAQTQDVIDALLGLGYTEKQAAPAVDDALAALGGEAASVSELLRAALRLLTPPKR